MAQEPIEELTIKVSTNFNKATKDANKLKKALEGIGNVSGVSTGTSSSNSSEGSSSNGDKGVPNLGAGSSKASKFLEKLKAINIDKKIKSVTSKLDKPMGKLSMLFSSLKRVAFYRIIRSILSATAKLFSQGISRLYNFSKTFGNNNFSSAMDSLANTMNNIGNTLATVIAPAVQLLSPFIQTIGNYLTPAIEGLAMVLSKKAGLDGYWKAIKLTDEEAAKLGITAEKTKQSLMGFDEINTLDSDSNTSGYKFEWIEGFDTEEFTTAEEKINKITDAIVLLTGAFAGLKLALAGKTLGTALLTTLGVGELASLTSSFWDTLLDRQWIKDIDDFFNSILEALGTNVDKLVDYFENHVLKQWFPIISVYESLKGVIEDVGGWIEELTADSSNESSSSSLPNVTNSHIRPDDIEQHVSPYQGLYLDGNKVSTTLQIINQNSLKQYSSASYI